MTSNGSKLLLKSSPLKWGPC